MRRTILALLSDTHGGHKLGLLNPDVVLYDEKEDGGRQAYTPALTASQEYLWEIYLVECLQKILSLAAGDEVVLLHNGDETQGMKYVSELVTTRMSDQIMIAAANMQPWMEYSNVKTVRLAIGTGAHDFGEGASTILTAELLRGKHPRCDIQALYHGLMDIGGVTVDYAHHGPHPGSRVWLKGNTARFYLRDLMLQEIVAGRVPPRLVVRSHYHEPIIETLTMHGITSTLIITPSMCLLGDHGRQATRSAYQVTNGMVAVEMVDGKLLDVHTYFSELDIRTKETL